MEFPNVGKRCAIEECKQLDFLPIVCEHCHIIFCKEHFSMNSHKCPKLDKNVTNTKKESLSYICSDESCKDVSIIEMQCIKCKKHYCVKHRYHGCIEITDDEKKTKLKKWQIPKKQFAEAKAIVDQQVSDSLRKSKNTVMANKVRLMKVKGSAIGPKNVPTPERCYFLVHLPPTLINKHIGPTKGVYVNTNWTIGRAIDAIADTLKVSNNNSTSNACKLRLFHHSTGSLICNEMDTLLSKLFDDTELINGQDVILDYSDNTSVDTSLYK